MRHATIVLQGMSQAGAMQIVSAIANGATSWTGIVEASKLNTGRVSLLLKVMRRKGVVVQDDCGYHLTPDAVQYYEAALYVQAGYEKLLSSAAEADRDS